MIEYTEDHVPQKRMAASAFRYDFLNKKINFVNKDELTLLKETIDLYLNCDKIGEEDLRIFLHVKNNVMEKLKNF